MFSFSRSKPSPSARSAAKSGNGDNHSDSAGLDLKAERRRKVEQLLRGNPTIEVKNEAQYDIALRLPDRRVVRLRVTLPPKFPQVPPSVQIMSQAKHPWLSSDGYCRVVGCRELQNWTIQSELGAVVKVIVDEFCRTPPTLLTSTEVQDLLSNLQSKKGGAQTKKAPAPPARNQAQEGAHEEHGQGVGQGNGTGVTDRRKQLQKQKSFSERHISLPPVPSHFPPLRDLSEDALEGLLRGATRYGKQTKRSRSGSATSPGRGRGRSADEDDDVAAYLDFFESLPLVQTCAGMCEDIKKGNADVAKDNISHEEEVGALTAEIQSLHKTLNDKRRGFASLLRRQDAVLQRFSRERIAQRLSASTAEADEQSEMVADAFLEGDIPLREFSQKYVKVRVLHHRRGAKLECLQ